MKELSLNILDIVQNSVRAMANEILIEVKESIGSDLYQIVITDNGNGIPDKILKNVTDPFVTTRTKRKMGLGLPLLKYHAELTGGGLVVNSRLGKGTEVKATFLFGHIDRQPLGDITGVLTIMLATNPGINFIYRHITDKGEYLFSSKETKEYLETDSLTDINLLKQISGMIRENLKEIEASGIDYKEFNKENL
jgi:hypothetical protein